MGPKIGQEAQEEGRVRLMLISGRILFCVLVSIGNHVQCFEQYFILVVPPLQRLKSFESSLRTLKCVCVDYSYHIRKLAYS